jgi:hypothetical protein
MPTHNMRRAPARFLQGTPGCIADVFDEPGTCDRYTVFMHGVCEYRGDLRVAYLGLSDNPSHPQGVSLWGEMSLHDFRSFRYTRARKHRVAWADLPEAVRKHIEARVAE